MEKSMYEIRLLWGKLYEYLMEENFDMKMTQRNSDEKAVKQAEIT
jgi:hypothetical protein